MTHDHFRRLGATLIDNGYLIIPIREGEKRPALSSWQSARIAKQDLPKYANHGVGVLCGQGDQPIVGIDVDISHPAVGAAVIKWCRAHMGAGGERVGAAPRILLAYRAAESGWAKGASLTFFDPQDATKPNGKRNEQRIEVLGLGQQFVAYHQHPDTGQPYEWVDLWGGLEAVHARDLPVITAEQVTTLMTMLHDLVAATPGLEVVQGGDSPVRLAATGDGDWLMSVSPTLGLTIEQAAGHIGQLDNEQVGLYEIWLSVGMALHHEFGGSDEAFALWDSWSAKSDKYDHKECVRRWPSFGRSTATPVTARWLVKMANQARHDASMREKRAAIDQVKTLLASAADGVALTEVLTKKIKPMMLGTSSGGGSGLSGYTNVFSGDALLSAEVGALVKARFKEVTGAVLPAAELKSMLAPERTHTVRKQRPLTEFGNAERMLDRYHESLMYVPETDVWYVWSGVYWRMAQKVEIEHYAKETIRVLVDEHDEHADTPEFFKFCAISQQAKMVKNMVTLAASDPRVMVPVAELDKNSHLLGVGNGVVDLRTQQLLPPAPQYRVTKVAGASFDAEATCPVFEQTLLDVFFGDRVMVAFVQRLIGYTLLGQPNLDFMVIPFGNGSNGKSTVLGTIRKMFGGYARSADAASFVTDPKTGGGGSGGAREDLLRLKGARFVYVNEPDENSELREGAVKAMTGGDALSARGVYAKSTVEFEPTWVSFLPTNHKPIIKGSDNGIWRRLILLPFLRNFENDPNVTKDEKRGEKLEQEIPGVLAWAVRGVAAFLDSGIGIPESVKTAGLEYRQQMDLLADWLAECCEVGDEFKTPMADLWASWEAYAKANGTINYIRSSTALGRRLDNRFPQARDRTGARARKGLKIRLGKDPFGIP